MPNIRVALPSHISTIPFLFGLQNHAIKDEVVTITRGFHESVRMLKSHKVEIALVPIETLPEFDNYHIVSEYCISSQREMQSAFLVINGDVSNLTTIYLDEKLQVATSLVQILANGYWKCSPTYQPLISMEKAQNLKFGEGAVLVGNEAIAETYKLGCTIDLSGEWKKFTGLPFVVAVWISLKPLPETFTEQFDSALRFGVNSIDEALVEMTFGNEFPKARVRKYLSQEISYTFDHEKEISMQLFLKLQAQRIVAKSV